MNLERRRHLNFERRRHLNFEPVTLSEVLNAAGILNFEPVTLSEAEVLNAAGICPSNIHL